MFIHGKDNITFVPDKPPQAVILTNPGLSLFSGSHHLNRGSPSATQDAWKMAEGSKVRIEQIGSRADEECGGKKGIKKINKLFVKIKSCIKKIEM